MINFKSIAELVSEAGKSAKPISQIAWDWEVQSSGCDAQDVWRQMEIRFQTIKEAAHSGLAQQGKTLNGLIGGDAYRLSQKGYLLGPTARMAAAYAVAVSEVNANMGKIVACPTAGSCGIVPGVILAAGEFLECGDEALVRALFTAAAIGNVIAQNATVSGAVGGCQAECGSAAAMAAGAAVEICGGTPAQSASALALALKNLLGLACDPVAGLVEVPCVKRNGFAAVHALVAAEMALAGVESLIPADEVIDAMYRIGQLLPSCLRETSEAGLACTPTAMRTTERLLK